MEIWSKTIGPVEYYRGLAIVCFLLSYGGRIPTYWPVAIILTALWLFAISHLLKANERTLRIPAKMTEIQRIKFLLLGAGSILGHAILIRVL